MKKGGKYDVVVIGGGPAGLAAAIEADKCGSKVLLVEREARLGGILKQCIHDGFGLVRFGEKLSGPEYVERFIKEFRQRDIDYITMTFVTEIKKKDGEFELVLVNKDGLIMCEALSIVLATGCRERTAKQVSIHGTRPSGVFTAGTAQNYVNVLGQMPTKKCVILGSGDIGLIMARRLTLEGADVVGVYEAKSTPSGLTRNIVQCLEDFDIPLYLSHTVTRIFGHDRLEAVEISEVDSSMKPVAGTQKIVECDSLILSVGLIPENEIALDLEVSIDMRTKGPFCNQSLMTDVDGVFSCGNSLHVNDLVDYVSESGEIAGKNAALYSKVGKQETEKVRVCPDNSLGYIVPQKLEYKKGENLEKAVFFFRSKDVLEDVDFELRVGNQVIYSRKYSHVRPPEMERIEVDFSGISFDGIDIEASLAKRGMSEI